MGRAGSGGSSGGHSSGGHSNSRISGGHHIGGSTSHRAGSGSSFNGRHESSYGGGNFHGGYHGGRNIYMGPTYVNGGYYGSRRSSLLGSMLAFIIVIIIVFVALGTSNVPKSTVNREKVQTGVAFNNNCVVDEIGWIDNISKTKKRLQNFYNKTGIQPYIVLHAYDPSLNSDSAKEAYANDYYENNIDNEGTFLFMYFAEQDTDNDIGYMCYVNGKQITTVMDSEAIDIFWSYMDSNWVSDKTTDDVIVDTFDSTAKRIMTKTATGADVGAKFGIAAIIIVIIGGIIVIMKVRRKNEHEKSVETERILNADIHKMPGEDDLADKYTK